MSNDSPRRSRRWLKIAAICVAVVALLLGVGSFMVMQGVDEYYSRDWQSTSSNDAKRKGVFVAAPAVMPAAVAVSDSVEMHVTDAWVERPTHVHYRWGLVSQVLVDSGYRLVLHLARGPVTGHAWTLPIRDCFASVDYYLNDQPAGQSGDFATEVLFDQSRSSYPDTVHLRVVRHDRVSLPQGAPPSPIRDCQ